MRYIVNEEVHNPLVFILSQTMSYDAFIQSACELQY